MTFPHDLLMAGLPRAGTTLACRLLHTLSNVCSLVEPMEVGALTERGEAVSAIQSFVRESRQGLLLNGLARTVHAGGLIPDNMFETYVGPMNLRRRNVECGTIRIEKPLTTEFTLVIKHPAMFTALLDVLHPQHRCCAVVRNPLSVLASWNTVDAPFQRGFSPVGERFDPELHRRLHLTEDLTSRQLALLSWYFERFRLLERHAVIRYEDLIQSGGQALASVVPEAAKLNEPLQSRNLNTVYPASLVRALATRLADTDGAFWDFYTPGDVLSIAQAV